MRRCSVPPADSVLSACLAACAGLQVAHDWGGTVAWNTAVLYPQVCVVCSLAAGAALVCACVEQQQSHNFSLCGMPARLLVCSWLRSWW